MKEVYFDSKGESGNIFEVLSMAYRELKSDDGDDMIRRVITCESYDEALKIIREYVNLIDVHGER